MPHSFDMTRQMLIAFMILICKCANAENVVLSPSAGDKLYEVWDEEVPIMGHLAMATDGSVLVFKERRDQKMTRELHMDGSWP